MIVITFYFANQSMGVFHEQVEGNLKDNIKSILKMFEREANLKNDKVETNLKVAKAAFLNSDFQIRPATFETKIKNQKNDVSHPAKLNKWYINSREVYGDQQFVDSMQNKLGGTFTIFQKTDSGFVRMATNVLLDDGQRAVGTYIAMDSPVSKSVLKGKTYYGRAFVVDDWYITAYEPIIYDEEIAGMIYVGDKEKDLDELKNILYDLEIGKSGYPFAFDKEGYLIIHPEREGEFLVDSTLFKQVSDKKEGVIQYYYKEEKKTVAFEYFDKFDIYIAAAVRPGIETWELKRRTILGAIFIGVGSILLLLGVIYYFTTDRISRFFSELQKSRKKLDNVSRALEESEERYRKLFDSTGDDIFLTDIDENIIEVNTAACETLGYTKNELTEMKISVIKSEKYKNNVHENRKIIYEKGSHSFESEHVTKAGKIIHVEFISRLVSYEREKLILSVVRNISNRVESERQILSAVIKGEERERHRFAREMHDGLGPLLSAVKLYINELGSVSLSEDEKKELIKHSNELIDEAVNTTRNISNNLMPTVINSYGLVKAVQAYCDKVNKTNQLNVKFETENIDNRLDSNLELIFFRVISELINNTLKHANAENVYILLVKYENRLTLYFKDDGVGFDVDEIIQSDNKGMGLKNIISRIKSISGKYSFNSIPGKGFTIKIDINY